MWTKSFNWVWQKKGKRIGHFSKNVFQQTSLHSEQYKKYKKETGAHWGSDIKIDFIKNVDCEHCDAADEMDVGFVFSMNNEQWMHFCVSKLGFNKGIN